MDHEKFPNYFLVVVALYAIVLLIGLGYFIIPSISFGAAYADFLAITLLFFLPLVLLAVYEKSSRFEMRWGKESALRVVITALVVVDFAIDLFLLIFLI